MKRTGKPMSKGLRHKLCVNSRVLEQAMLSQSHPVRILDCDLKIAWANEGAASFYCSTVKEMLGKHCYEVYYKRNSPCQECPALETLRTSKPAGSPFIQECPAGGRRWYEVSTMPIFASQGTISHIVESVKDLSVQKLKEESLSRESKVNRAIAETCSALVSAATTDEIALTVLEHARDLTKSSHGYVGYIGPSSGALVCPAWTEDILAGSRKGAKKAIFKNFRGLRKWVLVNKQSVLSNNPEKDPRFAGVPSGHLPIRRLLSVPALLGENLVGQILLANAEQDYTEADLAVLQRLAAVYALAIQRKQAFDAIIRSKENWEKTFDAINDAVLLLDKEGFIILANNTASKMLKADKEALIGKRCHEVIKECDSPLKNCPLHRTMRTLTPHSQEITEPRLGGTFICSTSPIFDHDGNLSGFTHTLRNATESKRLEAQLQHAQKMTAIGTLAGGIAHDFNNILQAISGYTQLLLMRKEKDDQDCKYLDQIEKSSHRAADLIQRLLLFSQQVESKIKVLDLNQTVEHVTQLLERTIPKMISIETHSAKNLKLIKADPVQMEQIVVNLAVNAKDAMPEGGRLIFRTESLDRASCHVLDGEPGECVLLTVSDTGTGIDPKTLERVFEPFFTTKETGQGTGLGLAVVYGIVKSHGGHISCESQPGQGTTFRIYLPVAELENQEESRQKLRTRIPKGTETILLADDDPNILEIAKEYLEGHGYRVITVDTGEKAIEAYQAERDNIGVAVLDIGMPGMGGKRCTEELLKFSPDLKIIIASGYAPGAFWKEASQTVSFMPKPYRLRNLLLKIRKVLDDK